MGGNFFKIDRAIFDHSIWQDPVQFRIFFYLVGKAVWSEDGIVKGNIHIKRGHYLCSYRRLRDELEYIENNAVKKYPLSRIHRAIAKLEAAEMIRKHETELGTLFEVVNYSKYQDKMTSDNLARNATQNEDGTQMEQQRNNNKKEKKEKNEKKDIQQQGMGDSAENWSHAYQMYYGHPSMTVIQLMNSYLDDGMEQKLLSYALEKAAENGAPFHYAKGIINKWLGKNILTIDAAKAEEEEFNKRKAGRNHGNRKPQTHKPNPKYGTDRSKLDFSSARNSL